MDKIRVLLANHPVMVPDAIRELVAKQEDMEVVGDCRGPMKILQEAGRTKADVVIFSQEGNEELGLCSQLLAVYPDLTIISMAENDVAFTQQLCAHRYQVLSSGLGDIIKTLRTAVRDRCGENRL
ncbi:MAG: response regulator transcription factor [Nitrospira sp.]|nr:response regulator transcription factor [Nitrospira sp.]MBX3337178.1 response regulator transcription factor [Nitrospira sp.]MCW5780188.1 response regulator transcription factor [Nitrospira sp.]HNK16321.1 hypothetical protein [Nitrospira sp.]